ncbi:ABC transporter [Xylariales sp. AK1849]|nr:ABC transporter [Xylariales sp. AK1849]
MAFLRQTWTLTAKNLKIILIRHSFATVIRAFVLPIVLGAFLTFARNLLASPAVYGIGDPRAIRSIRDALPVASRSGRETVAFVNSGHSGGDIDRVIDSVADMVTDAGRTATRLSTVTELRNVCRSSLRGVSTCYGAVVFNASPSEGSGGIWNYTLRADGALGVKIDATKDNNDGEIYTLPLQRAVDSTIANLVATGGQLFPTTTNEYPFTSITEDERAQQVRQAYQTALTNFLAVAFVITIIGVCYHMTGFMATEREIGMSQLLDAMMLTKNRWEAQAARLLSYHIAFTMVYIPGWVIPSIIIGRGVFATTNVAILIIYFILCGLAFTSLSILGGAFFKRSQLSGVVSTIVYLLFGILAQSLTSPNTATVAILSLLFTPCNFVYFFTYVASFEKQTLPTDLVKRGPDRPWNLPGIVFWVFLIIQIFAYPFIGAYLERKFHGTTTKGRTILRRSDEAPRNAVQLDGFTKIYKPSALRRLFSFISHPREPVVAVDNLTLTAGRGQILALLGANGSGKSTTLDSIAGTSKLTSGNITIDGTGGLGIAPQKNVLWEELTVFEHIQIFNRLKSPGNTSTKADITELVNSVDLGPKLKAMSRTLSGGQKRKLQLGMMLTGGSAVCCVDEVSSGIDPLSRRKVWDILLAERGKRTIILTTHFLDEADLLADQIAILSKGTLRAEGSSVELKDRLGAGYRIHVFNARDIKDPPEVEGVTRRVSFDVISYIAKTSAAAAEVIRTLERSGIHDYKYSGPTIEDVFLQVAEEVKGGAISKLREPGMAPSAATNDKHRSSEDVSAVEGSGSEREGLELLSGQRIGWGKQILILFLKRCTVFKRNWFPYVAAFLIPIVAAGLIMLFIKGQEPASCTPTEDNSSGSTSTFTDLYDSLFLVAGPTSQFSNSTLTRLFLPIFQGQNGDGGEGGASDLAVANATASFAKSLHLVDSLDNFNNFVVQNRKNVTPAGWWLGDANSLPTLAYRADALDVYTSVFGQNALNIMLGNISIATAYAPFNEPWIPGTGNSLQVLVYICLALSAYPAFFGLYPNIERRRNVRGLQYSNGVRSVPLWTAYIAFDFAIVLVSTAIVTIIFAALSNIWYRVAYLFLIFMLYGLASTLLAYVISLFCKTQLSAYAFAAAGQAIGFLIYLVAYLCVITYAPVDKIDDDIILVHFIVSAFVPIGSVVRTLFIALNLFSTTCSGDQLAPNPAAITVYGGPILYLVLQSLMLFGILLWYDSGAGINIFHRFTQKSIDPDADAAVSDEEVAQELTRVTSTPQESDGLRVMHLTKSFGKNTAVDNATFGVKHGEVFALLGPNGAGKSTTISLIRGDIQPSRNGGDVFVEKTSVSRRRAAARSHLGVCPQFDAIDAMTVQEHLQFYAKIRGIPDVDHNVKAVLRAVGLEAFSTRMASDLSGGNKRKLSLGIALMGNPSVVLLDEPSSGLDAAAKRIMWHTLGSIVPGRSILLTTHSMEEADALANRAGILAKRMLAIGTTENLRQRFGDALHAHLVSKTAPHSTPEEMEHVRQWVLQTYPGAQVEEKTYHGQMRFSVPASAVLGNEKDGRSAVGQLIVVLEEQKEALGIEHYSVSPTTLDQVFLTIVGQHNVQEENYGEKEKKSWWRFGL